MDRQLTQTHCRTPPKTPGSLHPGNLSSGFANIIEVHSGSWKIFPITLNLSLSSKGKERKEQTRKKEEKNPKGNYQWLGKKWQNWAGKFWMQEEKRRCIQKTWRRCKIKDRLQFHGQVLKTYLLKPQEAQTQMFKSDYSCFTTLKLSLGKGQKMKTTIA